jgi:hypothetical protein
LRWRRSRCHIPAEHSRRGGRTERRQARRHRRCSSTTKRVGRRRRHNVRRCNNGSSRRLARSRLCRGDDDGGRLCRCVVNGSNCLRLSRVRSAQIDTRHRRVGVGNDNVVFGLEMQHTRKRRDRLHANDAPHLQRLVRILVAISRRLVRLEHLAANGTVLSRATVVRIGSASRVLVTAVQMRHHVSDASRLLAAHANMVAAGRFAHLAHHGSAQCLSERGR